MKVIETNDMKYRVTTLKFFFYENLIDNFGKYWEN